jgi:Family of unknown function (DUF6328)
MTEGPAEHGHEESADQTLDRNLIELLNELRVSGTGIQVLFAFLLVVPFNVGYQRMSQFDRIDYFVALLCIAIAAALLIAPTVHHRLLFRHHERAYIVRTANRAAIAGTGFLAVGLTTILVLISNVVFGGVAAVIVGTIAGVVVLTLWFAIPLRRRWQAAAR